MRKILFTLLLFIAGLPQFSKACNNSTFDVVSSVDNMDGTTTYTLDLGVELGNDGVYLGFALIFDSMEGSPTVNSFSPASIAPHEGLSETLTGLTGADINSVAADSDFAAYGNMDNVLTYEYNGCAFCNAASNDFNQIVTVTINGCAELISLNPHVNSVSGTSVCYRPIGISNVTAGAQSACSIVDNTYTQDVTVTYTGLSTPATLTVNGQTFPVTTSPQTVTLIGLNANGAPVDASAEISTALTCPAEVTSLFTAPAACAVVACSVDNVALGNQSACNSSNNTYSQEVIVTYSNPPATGTLNVNGVAFAIGTSPQTVTLSNLTADGNVVNGTVEFSADTGCNDVFSYTAPASCALVCSIDNVVAGTPSACNPADNTYTCDVTVTYSNPPGSGNLVINGQSFSIGTSPQTETLIGLISNGNVVNGTVEFSADTGCNDTVSFTAPVSCGVTCNPDNGTWN